MDRRRYPRICATGTGWPIAARKRAGFDILLPLWRAWLRHHPAFPVAANQPAYGRIWRLAGKPGRLLKEMMSDARDEVGDSWPWRSGCRSKNWASWDFPTPKLRDFIAMNADLPDLWDLAHGTWEACSGTSRFKPEAAQEDVGPRDQGN